MNILAKLLSEKLARWPSTADRARASHLVPEGLVVQFYDGKNFVNQYVIDCAGLPALLQHGDSCTRKEFFQVSGANSGPPPGQPVKPAPRAPFDTPGYEKLADVLARAYEQSAGGKGKERHATGLPFHMQPIVTGAHSYGVGGPLFQVGKKSREAFGMVQRGQTNAAVHELLGAIVYAAGAIVAIEQDEPE